MVGLGLEPRLSASRAGILKLQPPLPARRLSAEVPISLPDLHLAQATWNPRMELSDSTPTGNISYSSGIGGHQGDLQGDKKK